MTIKFTFESWPLVLTWGPVYIHNNTNADYWPLIAVRDQMLYAGVDINGFAPVTLDELIENNRRFKEECACTIDGST